MSIRTTKKLFKNLMTVCNNSEMFYYVDQTTPLGTKSRIFTYRLAGYSDWLQTDALECRGIMFELDDKDVPIRIMSRPMEKFFNYSELKAWEKLEKQPAKIGEIEYYMTKEDGSLVSTYTDSASGIDYVFFKSKASLHSEQAVSATRLLTDDIELYNKALEIAKSGSTMNFEYVAPNNRIVLGYDSAKLILLNIRNNDTGEYWPESEIANDPVLSKYMVDTFRFIGQDVDLDNLMGFVKDKVNEEGIVVKTTTGFIKMKSEWYVNMHRTKDSLNNNKDLFTNVVNGVSDDLRQMFIDDELALAKIRDFENSFISNFSHLINHAMQMIEKHKGKDRKSFACDIQAEQNGIEKLTFSALMKWYTNSDIDIVTDCIKDAMMRNMNMFIPEAYKKDEPK
ncbi:RNA ligase 1 [Morganella phage vB_Mm5]